MLYVDNDVLLKFCSLDLMNEVLDHLGVPPDDVRVLDTAYAMIRGASTRASKKETFLKRYGADGVERALAFAQGAKHASGHEPELYDRLALLPNMHVGEAVLIAIVCADPTARLLTGDKNCIGALGDAACADVVAKLKGRVLTFETVLLALFDRLGFTDCNRRVKDAMTKATIDGFLALAVRDDENHVRGAFDSAIREAKTRCPGLFDA